MELRAARHERPPADGGRRAGARREHLRPCGQHLGPHREGIRFQPALHRALRGPRHGQGQRHRAGPGLDLRPDPPGIALHHGRALACGRVGPDAADAGDRKMGRGQDRHDRFHARQRQRFRHQHRAGHQLSEHGAARSGRFADAGQRRLQRRPAAAAQLAFHLHASGRGRDLRRDHPVQRDAHLRQERDVELCLLRGHVQRPASIPEGAAGQGRALGAESTTLP